MESASTRHTNVLTWARDTLSLSIVTAIFLLWGLLTYVHGELLDLLHDTIGSVSADGTIQQGMTPGQTMALSFVFFGTYFLLGYPAGMIIRRIGYKSGMVMGLTIAAVGCITIIPSALQNSYLMVFSSVVILASGITFLQVAANPYVLFVSRPKTSAARLTFVQGFNSLGNVLALIYILNFKGDPAWESSLHCTDTAFNFLMYRQEHFMEIITPYLILASLFIIAAIVLTLSSLPEASAVHLEGEIDENRKKSAFQYPHLVFGALAIFAYVGAEIAVGGNLTGYYDEISEAIAYKSETIDISVDIFIYSFLFLAVIGRFLGAFLLKRVEPHDLLTYCAIGSLGMVFMAISLHNELSLYAIALVGLFNSIMFPVIFSLGVRGLGKHSEEGSSILVMAISGGAVIPFIFKLVHDAQEITGDIATDEFHHTHYDKSLWVVFTCYMVIVFFGLFGYRFKRAVSIHHD